MSSTIQVLRKELLAMMHSLEEKRIRQESTAAKARYSKKYSGHLVTLVQKKKEHFAKKVQESIAKVYSQHLTNRHHGSRIDLLLPRS